MTVQALIRQIQMLIGDPGGNRFSKEMIVDLINEEAPRVLARFPKTVFIETTQEATEPAYAITSADLDLSRLVVTQVYIDTLECRKMDAQEMERITQS